LPYRNFRNAILYSAEKSAGLQTQAPLFQEDHVMRWFLAVLFALLAGIGIYAGSALVSLSGLVEAARAGDGAAVLARTDTERLRRSLVDQIVSAYLKQLGRDRPVKPLEQVLANTYGATIADAMIAKMLTEENLTRILKTGAISAGERPIANMQGLGEIDTSSLLEMLSRISPVKPAEFLVWLGDGENAGGVNMHFEGSGWKLSGIQLPAAAVQALAQSLIDSKGRKG
jgi:hypothetical protein